jgi:hypothetical protein
LHGTFTLILRRLLLLLLLLLLVLLLLWDGAARIPPDAFRLGLSAGCGRRAREVGRRRGLRFIERDGRRRVGFFRSGSRRTGDAAQLDNLLVEHVAPALRLLQQAPEYLQLL